VLRQTLSGALQSLPKRWREVIVLRYLVGLSEPEVATALGLSLGTVKTHTAAAGEKIAGWPMFRLATPDWLPRATQREGNTCRPKTS
jgi:DNA-directed RNA polymerase specialized sigma24 family protein